MTALLFCQNMNRVIGILFLLCNFYQLPYVPVALWRRHRVERAAPLRRYAVLISARNEEAVIGQLLESIQKQDYPADHLIPFVVADNCTDGTARAAKAAGAGATTAPG